MGLNALSCVTRNVTVIFLTFFREAKLFFLTVLILHRPSLSAHQKFFQTRGQTHNESKLKNVHVYNYIQTHARRRTLIFIEENPFEFLFYYKLMNSEVGGKKIKRNSLLRVYINKCAVTVVYSLFHIIYTRARVS